MDEISKLTVGNELGVYDRSGVKYKGILLEPAIIRPDSTQVLVIETVPGKEKYRFGISSDPGRAEVTKVSIPRKPTASTVLTGGVLGLIGGAVAGSYVGNALAPKYDDTLVYEVLGGILGAFVGFATSAIIVESATGELILIVPSGKD